MPIGTTAGGIVSNPYSAAGLPEWVRYDDDPDVGHHPDPQRPTHTRCGRPIADATPADRPRYGHTDCLPRGSGDADVDDEGSLWDGSLWGAS